MIKAVFYDMGDILFESNLWRKWMYEKIISFSNFTGTFPEFYELYEFFLLPVYKNKKKYDEAYDDFLKHLNVPEPEEFKKASFKIKRFFEENRELYEGVEETLRELRARNILNIIITDNEQGSAGIRKNILSRFKINNLIDDVVSSKEYGLTKPDPGIFKLSLSLHKLKNYEVLFVGHDREELDGAEDVGIKAVEFNNYLKYPNKAEFKIDRFTQLVELVDALNRE